MGKFENDMKKKFWEEIEDFDTWFEKNQDKLSDFKPKDSIEQDERSDVKVRVKSVPVLIIMGMFLLAVILMCFLFIGKPNEELTFKDDTVYNQVLSETEIDVNKENYPFLKKFFNLTGNNLLKQADDCLVMTIFEGEMETENYYLATIQIEVDKNYVFYLRAFMNRLRIKDR